MERISEMVTRWSGTTTAFACAFGLVVVWLLLGPVFGFSNTWQLVINTTTTIVTFLMVFLIQRAQNKEARATALKLNEVIASIEGASNRLIDVEDLSEEELETLHKHFRRLVEMAARDSSLTRSHSIEEASSRHRIKLGRRRAPDARGQRPDSRRRGNGLRNQRQQGPRTGGGQRGESQRPNQGAGNRGASQTPVNRGPETA